nr:C47 family peptidase [Lactococcus paracarnosus]
MVNWSSPNAYQTYLSKSKNFNYDFFSTTDNAIRKDLGRYLPSLTIYNIRQKSEPENASPQFKPTTPSVTPPVKTATYNTNNNFGIRETQNQEPWCSSYVEAAAVNAFRKATDVPVTSAQILMKLNRPGLSDDELKKVSGTTIADNAKKIKDNYNIGVTIVDRALSFSEVKTEIDSGKIVQMDAYNINATTPEDGYGHALAIVGYVTPNDGDMSKSPYYEIWNPWWNSTFYIPANNETFRLAGIDYKWTRSWYNWRQDGVGSVAKKVETQPVTSMGNPNAGKLPALPQNSLLAKQNKYSILALSPLRDIMTEQVTTFGRETSIQSATSGFTFGYAFSKGGSEFMRAKKDRTVKITKNMNKAKGFSDSVDDIISARNQIAGFGIGTALFMTVYIALQFIPVANWIGDGALSLISLITGGGFFLDSANLAKEMYNYYMASQSANILFSDL